jgi:hypothetical protein
MNLPFAEQAIVADAKLVDYLLDPSHPRGRGKARFFLDLGFQEERPEGLRAALLTLAQTSDMVAVEHPYGTKYVGDGEVRAPNGSLVRLRTVWLLDGNRPPPRFVTAYPAPRLVR